MLKLVPNPSYSLNLLNLLDLSVDSPLFPLILLILDFFLFDFFFRFIVLLPLVGGIPWNIRSGLTSDGSKLFFFL